jgi:menaquinone-dependent protoporphyrinogen oxidase
MKRIIVYASSKGAVEKCAHTLAEKLEGVDLHKLGKGARPDLASYDQVILGSSIHAGQPQKRMTAFRTKHEEELLGKELGLYICCLAEDEKVDQYLAASYGDGLLNHAKAVGKFGAQLIFKQYNFLLRRMLKKIIGTGEDIYKIRSEEINRFAEVMSEGR